MKKPLFEVGHKFIRRGKNRKDVETIIDILTTTNLDGYVVKIEYVVTHDFMGQTITDHVIGATIALGEPVKE